MTSARDRAVEVLIVHQRHGPAACLCGWSILGLSHCEHQVDMLEEAGLEVVPRRPAGTGEVAP